MENINKIIHIANSAVIFCIGLFLLILESGAYSAALSHTRDLIKEDVIYQQQNSVDRTIISYAELLTTLMQSLDYQVVIDALTIDKEEHNRYMVSDYGINQNDYLKSYRYQANGDISAVIYTSIR